MRGVEVYHLIKGKLCLEAKLADALKITRVILNQSRMFKYNRLLVPIEYLVFLIISVGKKKELITKYNAYKSNGQLPNRIASLIIRANFISHGKIRKQVISNLDAAQPVKSSQFFDHAKLEAAIRDLTLNGYASIGTIDDPKILQGLNELKNLKVYSGSEFKRSNRKGVDLVETPDQKIDHIWYVQPETVLDNHSVQMLIGDSFWQRISNTYLGTTSRVSQLRCWHSFPHEKGEILSPENWHLDAGDGLNFIKFFVLLSDVGDKSGPTAIIPIPSEKLPRKFFTGRRYSDSEIVRLLDRTKLKEIKAMGPIGHVYCADTRLLHRGTPVEMGSRFILNWTVSVDSFGTAFGEKYPIKSGSLLEGRTDILDF